MSESSTSSASVATTTRITSGNELNNAVQPLLTDLYQISMCYAYWKNQKNDKAVFDLFFRKNPFQGEFTIFCGLTECLKYIEDFKFDDSDIDYLRSAMPDYVEPEFFEYLRNMNMNELRVYAIREGSVVFPRIPLMRIEGPLPIVQLLETTLLVLINYASLVATNASRFRLAAGEKKSLLEFGLRRAQGPDGGLSASKYCYIGGFDGTSNVLAGKLYGIPIKGTHAHSFVSSFNGIEDVKSRTVKSLISGQLVDLFDLASSYLDKLEKNGGFSFMQSECNRGELAAFIGFASSFPTQFLALVDTYNVLKSGIPNFCAVALALNDLGYKARGIRLDSGDLAYLSLEVRSFFKRVSKDFKLGYFENLTIVASNDINEDILHSLNSQGHSIDQFGIGTHLVTCQKQPALGCVFKLVEVNDRPCVKLSEDVTKATFPGKKNSYRLYDKDDCPLVDLLTSSEEPAPVVGEPFLCRHPFIETKRAYLKPSKVENLLIAYWENGRIVRENLDTIDQIKERVRSQLHHLRNDHKRMLNPTPYKITVSAKLYEFIHQLWLDYTPIAHMT